MELRTYTSLWGVEKKLYKFYDVVLPVPVSVKQIGLTVAVVIPWFLLMNLLHVPFATPWHLVWLAPPFGIIYAALKIPLEGRPLPEFLISQVRFFLSAREYASLRPVSSQKVRWRITSRVWSRSKD